MMAAAKVPYTGDAGEDALGEADRARLIDRVVGKLRSGLAIPSTALLATGIKADR